MSAGEYDRVYQLAASVAKGPLTAHLLTIQEDVLFALIQEGKFDAAAAHAESLADSAADSVAPFFYMAKPLCAWAHALFRLCGTEQDRDRIIKKPYLESYDRLYIVEMGPLRSDHRASASRKGRHGTGEGPTRLCPRVLSSRTDMICKRLQILSRMSAAGDAQCTSGGRSGKMFWQNRGC